MVYLLGFSSTTLLSMANWFFLCDSITQLFIIPHLFFYFWPTRHLLSPPPPLLFILSTISCVIFIIFVCHNLLVATLPTMGLWSKLGKRGVVCAQAEPKWVVVGPVLTPLLRTLGPNTARGNPAQHCKKKAHYTLIIWFWLRREKLNFYFIFIWT